MLSASVTRSRHSLRQAPARPPGSESDPTDMSCYLLQIPLEGLSREKHLKLLQNSPTVTHKTLLNAIRKMNGSNEERISMTKSTSLEHYLELLHSPASDVLPPVSSENRHFGEAEIGICLHRTLFVRL